MGKFNCIKDGVLIDAGKVSPEFQKRITAGGAKCDHSTAGGVIAAQTLKRPDIGMCIMGHHGGMPNSGGRCDSSNEPTFNGRLKKPIPDYTAWSKLNISEYLEELPPLDPKLSAADHYLRTRLLYSALVDADFLDTERFYKPEIKRGVNTSINELAEVLEEYIAKKGWDEQTEGLNGVRSEISKSAKEVAKGERGIYSLTVPTGSGKTLASLRFALNYAKEHGLKRVIYVIPYVNIIEQTADTFKNILGDKNVLEHHSELAVREDNEEASILQLATENWDVPIVVTTAVQFFESLFANRSSRSRKVHNIADSVIIYDEVQMLPVENWRPLISIMEAINKNTPAVQLLCTATQPAIEFPQGTEVTEIAKNPEEYQDKLKRVTFKDSGIVEKEDIIDKLSAHKQALCILNTKKTAKELFELLPEGDGNFHLSTNMIPAHRREVLNAIRERLNEDKPVKLIATSLVEAGVDLDFEYVLREIAGLDSILQAAGRCNRNGKRPVESSVTEVFSLGAKPHPGIEQQTQAANSALTKYKNGFENGDYTDAIEYYFNIWRGLRGTDYLDVYKIMDKMRKWEHKNISEDFHMINSPTYTVYVPYDDRAAALIERLNNGEITREVMRALSQYSVQLYKRQIDKLIDAGTIYAINQKQDALFYILNYDYNDGEQHVYNKQTGLEINQESGNAVFI